MKTDSLTICNVPEASPSTIVVGSNSTHAQYTCRAGYRLQSGDFLRSCDVNGTWSGIQLVCAVDSILPKAYLVILIVGATVAVFLACIPYDFYRFRKRKKKVRDHHERLSLVTRIAPGHAKVVLETVPAEENPMEPLQGRRFGLKSLFSVFRFVGGKMKSQEKDDANSPTCSGDKNDESEIFSDKPSVSDVAPESEGATASSYLFSPQLAPSCLPAVDVIDFCSVAEDKKHGANSKDIDRAGELAAIEDIHIQAESSSPLVIDNNDRQSSDSLQRKKRFQRMMKAHILTETLKSQRPPANISSSCRRSAPSTDDSSLSEPATVEVTSINEATSIASENKRNGTHSEFLISKVGATSSSTSTPDVTAGKKGDPKVEAQFRTLYYPSVQYATSEGVTRVVAKMLFRNL